MGSLFQLHRSRSGHFTEGALAGLSVAEVGISVMTRSMPRDRQDDRFTTLTTGTEAVVAVVESHPVGLATLTDDPTDGPSIDLLIVDEAEAQGADHHEVAKALSASVLSLSGGPGAVTLWGRPVTDWHQTAADHLSLVPYRGLYQLRCRLPVDAPTLETDDFRPGMDDDELLTVNNRAFAHHPVQGRHTTATFADLFAQPWFRPEGVRMHRATDSGRLIGFCWTKIHPADSATDGQSQPAMGEIFVIGIDPDFHGQGLGVPMTASGLAWLADQGLTTGMLYVEADNAPALRTYEKLGFTHHREDRAWHRSEPRG